MFVLILLSGVAAVPSMPALAYHTPSADNIVLSENLDTRLGLTVKFDPPSAVIPDNATSMSLKLRLYEMSTNQTTPHVTYLVKLTRWADGEPVLTDVFHSHAGPVTLKFHLHDDDRRVAHRNPRDPVYNAWLADDLDTIDIDVARSALAVGVYSLNTTIIGMDNDTTAFETQDALKFSIFQSIGETTTRQAAFMGDVYDVQVLSYLGRVSDFDFDADKMQFSWSVPFDWNLESINSNRGLLVHHEIYVPKAFSEFFGNNPDYRFNATLNGKPVWGRQVAIDPYTYNSTVVFHYLLNRNDISAMAAELSNSTETPDTITFTLSPASATVPEFNPLYVLPAAVGAALAGVRIARRHR